MSQDNQPLNGRQASIWSRLDEILSDLAGFELDELDHSVSFLELGFDSLFLIQMSQTLKNEFQVDISFRQLIEQIPTFPMLMTYLDEIPFHQIGKGEQCIIKTNLALGYQKSQEANLILLEEPENHLSHTKLNELIKNLSEGWANKQVIISTHSNFVANKLENI